MLRTRSRRALAGGLIAGLLTGPLLTAVPATAAPSTARPATSYDKTSAAEARRVDRVNPTLDWWDCSVLAAGADCTTAELPLDYDQPNGAKTAVAVLRIKATDQQNKIGTLFLNPGGPGGSGVAIAAQASYFLGPEILAKFDIVGFDPRGTNYSDNVKCWNNLGEQDQALSGMNVAFPWTSAENKAYVSSAVKFGQACSTTGKPLSGSMSTAEVARDMDVLRRTLGDDKLNFLGFSYGTYLGNVYANLFPDRVRAIVIDGVLDPVAWAGTPATAIIPQTMRLKSGEGAAKALRKILALCATTGPEYCGFAGYGDPTKNYESIVASLKRAPIPVPDSGFEMTYARLTSWLLGDMYSPEGSAYVDLDLRYVWELLHPSSEAAKAAAVKGLVARAAKAEAAAGTSDDEGVAAKDLDFGQNLGYEWPYDNSVDAFASVLCTDGVNPARAQWWPAYAAAADLTAQGFGRLWTWQSAQCASRTWTVRDEDAYRGPFTRRTVNPVLVVGNYWDPATNYAGAVAVSRQLPNSRLLSSNSWGHTAYGTSGCTTDAVDSYLLTGALPARGTVCVGDVQPFTTPSDKLTLAPKRPLPPVVPPLPGAAPRTG